MTALELHFLGDFEVLKDGKPLPLPPSKKTRALLAYLSLNPRQFRREHLCELLWEIPDDPRGSLRWSLSKLRRLVDDDDQSRIIADRTNVGVDTNDVSIDVTELRALVGNGVAEAPLEELEAAAMRFRGNFLEGLEFPNFHDFHAWCVAEREQSLRDRVALLSALVARLENNPERALPHARALVGLSPYDEDHRALLIRLLNAANQTAEAEEQFQLGLRMLKEAGVTPSGAMVAARQGPRIDRVPSTPIPRKSRDVKAPAPRRRGLVGRKEEVGTLVEALDAVCADHKAAMVVVRGVPGIGKSCVLHSLLEYAEDANAFILQATAFESDAIRPFALWIDSLRALGSEVYEDIFGATDVSNRDRLFGKLSDLIAREAEAAPVLLLFDDLQWSDESSASALHYLMRMNRDRPIFAVVAARSGDIRDNAPLQQALSGLRHDGLLSEIELGPLPEDALSQLIAEQAPGADFERLSGECGGNPLLAIELARAEVDGSGGGSLNELVRERLGRFSTTGVEVLEWAAVLLPPVDAVSLSVVAGLDATEIGEVLEVAERQAMLVPADNGLRYSHDLIAKAVYADISPLRRQVMHRRAAEILEQESALDLARASWLGHHATLSGDPGLAARAMVSVGQLCLRFFANEKARSLARQGLQFAKELADPSRVGVEIDLHNVLLSAEPIDDWEAAAELYAALAERALDLGDLPHARLGYHMAAYVRWSQGEWEGAREQSLQSSRVMRGDDSKANIVGMAETAKCLVMLERDLSQADAMLMEADSLAQRRQFAHPAIAAGNGMLRLHENRLDEAEEFFQQSRTLCKSAGDRLNEFLASEYLVIIELQRGRHEVARDRAKQLVSLGEKIREGSEKPFADALLGLCNYAIDDDFAELDTALDALRVADAKYRLAYILTRTAVIDCERGRKQNAVERATEALEYATILERPTEMLMANAVLACGFGEIGAEEAAGHAGEVDRLLPAAASWAADIGRRLAEGHEGKES